VFPFVCTCQSQILHWRTPGLLDEPVQQHHPTQLIDIKQNTCCPVLSEIGANLMDSIFQRTADRHPNRPAELDRLNVITDEPTILPRGEAQKPFPHRFPSCFGPIEDRGNAFDRSFGHRPPVYHRRYTKAAAKAYTPLRLTAFPSPTPPARACLSGPSPGRAARHHRRGRARPQARYPSSYLAGCDKRSPERTTAPETIETTAPRSRPAGHQVQVDCSYQTE